MEAGKIMESLLKAGADTMSRQSAEQVIQEPWEQPRGEPAGGDP